MFNIDAILLIFQLMSSSPSYSSNSNVVLFYSILFVIQNIYLPEECDRSQNSFSLFPQECIDNFIDLKDNIPLNFWLLQFLCNPSPHILDQNLKLQFSSHLLNGCTCLNHSHLLTRSNALNCYFYITQSLCCLSEANLHAKFNLSIILL